MALPDAVCATPKGGTTMKRIFASADEFIRESSWKDLAILKFCLLSLGLLIGMQVSQRCKKGARIAAFAVFAITYIPLMAKYLKILIGEGEEV